MLTAPMPGSVTTSEQEIRRIVALIRGGSTQRAIGALEWLCRRARRRSARFGAWLDRQVREDRRQRTAEAKGARSL